MANLGPSDRARPSAMPSSGRRRPRVVLGTFWLVIALLCLIAGVNGLWWAFLVMIACIAYAVYLYRGGRYGFWFI